MPVDTPQPSPEREQTDESLHDEREKSDRAMAADRAAVLDSADEVLLRARQDADAVLLDAREKADQRLEESDPPLAPSVAVAQDRVLEDALLQQERAAADQSLEVERAETDRVLSRLLPRERDQTDLFLLNERVRSDDALANRDDFLGLVSHDLRDGLGAIVLSAALIAKAAGETPDGTRIAGEAARIQRQVARMNRLIGDLLDIASIDAGKLRVAPTRGDLAALLGEAVDAFTAAAAVKQIQIEVQCQEHPLPAEFDHARLFQVLANLIMNSIKFSPAGGRITVRGERDGGTFRCSVSDTGIGIAADQIETIFDRFSQVDHSDARGLGLGLFISRCIIEAHGGTIRAESTIGQGTCVTFTVPAVAHHAAPDPLGGSSPDTTMRA